MRQCRDPAALAPTHQLSQFRSRELLHSSPTSTSPFPLCSNPADSSSAVGTEQLWGGGGRNQPVWGQDGAVPVSLGTEAPLVAGGPGLGREGGLSCSGSSSSEQGWLVHMSLGSVVYFFKAGVCFLISKALLCSFPNKALKNPLPPSSITLLPSQSSLTVEKCVTQRFPAPGPGGTQCPLCPGIKGATPGRGRQGLGQSIGRSEDKSGCHVSGGEGRVFQAGQGKSKLQLWFSRVWRWQKEQL